MNRRVEQYKPKKRYRMGTISLHNAYTEHVVKAVRYNHKWERREKMRKWEKLFGPNFHKNYFILIEPDVNISDDELKEFEETIKNKFGKVEYSTVY